MQESDWDARVRRVSTSPIDRWEYVASSRPRKATSTWSPTSTGVSIYMQHKATSRTTTTTDDHCASFADGESKSQVPGGVYPFSLKLPEKIPCSFEGLYGRIRYSLRACLVLAEDLVFYTNVLPFTLALLTDLNRDSLAPVSRVDLLVCFALLLYLLFLLLLYFPCTPPKGKPIHPSLLFYDRYASNNI